jgi:hypothetical protein
MSIGRAFIRRQRVGDDLRKMGRLSADHWLVDKRADCPGCELPFMAGDYVTLVSIGPGIDLDERIRARERRAFDAVAIAVHWACATGEEN